MYCCPHCSGLIARLVALSRGQLAVLCCRRVSGISKGLSHFAAVFHGNSGCPDRHQLAPQAGQLRLQLCCRSPQCRAFCCRGLPKPRPGRATQGSGAPDAQRGTALGRAQCSNCDWLHHGGGCRAGPPPAAADQHGAHALVRQQLHQQRVVLRDDTSRMYQPQEDVRKGTLIDKRFPSLLRQCAAASIGLRREKRCTPRTPLQSPDAMLS